jgi:transcriptional repressor NF-X1
MVDQEPQRSVQLIRRIDTRVPAPLLSTTCGAPLPNPALGKLATNLRSPAALKTAPITAAGPNNTGRGWTSVINRAPAPALTAPQLNDLAAPQPTSSRWSQSMLASAARPTLALKPASSVPALTTPVAAAESGDVPDNWEDDL